MTHRRQPLRTTHNISLSSSVWDDKLLAMMHDSEPTTLKDNSQTLIGDVWLSGIKMSDLGVKVTVVGYDFKVRDWGARIKDWSPVYLGLYEVPFKIDAVERIEETFPT